MPRMKPPRTKTGPYQETLSLGALAKRWRLPRRQVRRLIQQGRLGFVEVQGRIRVPLSEAERAPSVS